MDNINIDVKMFSNVVLYEGLLNKVSGVDSADLLHSHPTHYLA